MKTASYAVMFTDIKGFTERTSRQTRAQNERLLRIHDAILAPVIAGYGGKRVKTIGDAYMVIFDSATRALAAGAALQDRLALYNRRADPAERIEVRVAINAGEVRVERKDVYGEAVNIAARIESQVADAGEVCFSEAVYLLADRTWIDVDDLGPHSLKGIPEPVRIFRLRRDEQGPMPYGGATLEALRLPEPDPAELGRRRFSPRRALRWAALAAIPLVVAVAALSLSGGGDTLARLEELVTAGQTREVERTLEQLPREEVGPAERAYLEGLIAEQEGRHQQAMRRFAAAAAADPALGRERVAPRVVGRLEDESCEVREAAARLLGELRYEPARGALEALSRREPAPSGILSRLRVGGCRAGDAAREALRQLDRKQG